MYRRKYRCNGDFKVGDSVLPNHHTLFRRKQVGHQNSGSSIAPSSPRTMPLELSAVSCPEDGLSDAEESSPGWIGSEGAGSGLPESPASLGVLESAGTTSAGTGWRPDLPSGTTPAVEQEQPANDKTPVSKTAIITSLCLIECSCRHACGALRMQGSAYTAAVFRNQECRYRYR